MSGTCPQCLRIATRTAHLLLTEDQLLVQLLLSLLGALQSLLGLVLGRSQPSLGRCDFCQLVGALCRPRACFCQLLLQSCSLPSSMASGKMIQARACAQACSQLSDMQQACMMKHALYAEECES